jgi:hypothetical protein
MLVVVVWAMGCGGGGSTTDADVVGEADDGEASPPEDDGRTEVESEAETAEDVEDVPVDAPDTEDAPPVTVGTCEVCADHAECGAPSRCLLLGTGTRVCSPLCNPEVPSCPRGFHCEENEAAPGETACVPISDTCCIDQDADGYGLGVDCRDLDCDDDVAETNPGMVELCNEVDDDCDGATDDDVTDCGVPECREDAAGAYEELPQGICTVGECEPRSPAPCGWYACWGGGGEGDACAVECAPLGTDDDVYCVAAGHCDGGLCLEDTADGLACDEDSDCAAGHCGNGFCCSEGDCCGVVGDCPGAGTVVTTCDDAATCQGTRGEAECVDHRCGTRAGLPDDSACDATVEADACGSFDSVFCTGAADQTAPACPTSCAADAECDAGAHCDGVCIPDLPDGDPCDEASDCVSDYCMNDVCCAAGDCCRSWADCPAWYGTAAVCDDPATCQGTRDAAVCIDFHCGTEIDTPDDRGCTTSTPALDCGLYPDLRCGGGEDQTPPVCATACVSDAECDGNAHCDEPACLADLANGSACDEDSDCIASHCQNGFCCAAGDCCVTAAQCPAATYGVPPTCDSAPTCQGSRWDPVCTSDNRCIVGPAVGDDSACAGLTSNNCGAYPAVSCTASSDQPSDQGALCATSCGTDTDCDPGAHCAGGVCVTDGNAGDPCVETRECGSGLSCVDNVCCTTACTGSCRACDVPGHVGTCWNIAANDDPDNECNGFSCAGYYWGWSGDSCYQRASASNSQVGCDGVGACQLPSLVCPGTGLGPVTLTCNALCQDPRSATCRSTDAGACDNVTPTPATQTCGTGYCQVTVNRCLAGVPQTCTPLSPRAETCNNIDDDCNGTEDDNISGAADFTEPNNVCGSPAYLGTIAEANSAVTWSRTIYPSSDTADFYRFYAEEGTHTCFPGTDQDYTIRVVLTPPPAPDCRDYDLVVYSDGCGSLGSSSAGGCATDAVQYTWDGVCGGDDSRYFRVEVRPYGSAWECRNYTLSIDMWQN